MMVLVLLRGHDADPPGVVQRVLHGLVGEDVELLLLLALHVVAPGAAEDVDQAGAPDAGRDDLGGERDVVEQVGELPGGLGVLVLLVEDEPLDGGDRGASGSPQDGRATSSATRLASCHSPGGAARHRTRPSVTTVRSCRRGSVVRHTPILVRPPSRASASGAGCPYRFPGRR